MVKWYEKIKYFERTLNLQYWFSKSKWSQCSEIAFRVFDFCFSKSLADRLYLYNSVEGWSVNTSKNWMISEFLISHEHWLILHCRSQAMRCYITSGRQQMRKYKHSARWSPGNWIHDESYIFSYLSMAFLFKGDYFFFFHKIEYFYIYFWYFILQIYFILSLDVLLLLVKSYSQ